MSTDPNEDKAMQYGLAEILEEAQALPPATDAALASKLLLMMMPKKYHHKTEFWTDPKVSFMIPRSVSAHPVDLNADVRVLPRSS